MSSLRSRVNNELMDLVREHGTVKPQTVLEAARVPESALHEDFKQQNLWDDGFAAEQARLIYAGRVIRIFMMRPSEDDQSSPVRALVSLIDDRKRSSGLPGYRHIDDVMNDEGLRENLLQTALMELRAFRRKYERLKELAQVWHAVEAVDAVHGRQTEQRASA